jgi:hypothetical protein
MRTQETPVHWLIHKINSPQEVITFQADLDAPPAFSLHMQNFRWFARSSSKTEIENTGWQFERLPSVMITTKPDTQKEIAGTMTSLSRGDNGDFLEVSFQRTCLLDTMREMAGSASVF